MEETKKMAQNIDERVSLTERVEQGLKTSSRAMVFMICLVSLVVFLLAWMGSIYYNAPETFFWGALFAFCLMVSIVAIINADKLMPKEKTLKYYLADLNHEKDWLGRMILKLKEEKRVLEILNPIELPPYVQINEIYQEISQQARMMLLQIEGENDQAALEILDKIHKTHISLTFESEEGWLPEKIDFLEKSQEERLSSINLLIKTISQKKAICADMAAQNKKRKNFEIALQIKNDEQAIEEINAQIEIVKNQLSIC